MRRILVHAMVIAVLALACPAAAGAEADDGGGPRAAASGPVNVVGTWSGKVTFKCYNLTTGEKMKSESATLTMVFAKDPSSGVMMLWYVDGLGDTNGNPPGQRVTVGFKDIWYDGSPDDPTMASCHINKDKMKGVGGNPNPARFGHTDQGIPLHGDEAEVT